MVSGKLVLTGLWDKLGIAWDGVQAGKAAGFWSMNRDFSEAEWERLEDSLDRVYEDFTGKVAAGRDMTPAAVADAAKGRIWSGEDALDRGLVDALGGLEEAFALAAEAAGAPGQRVRVKILPEPRDPIEAIMEELLAGRIPGIGLTVLARDLARLAAVLRPLGDAFESLSVQPRLQAPDPRPAD